MCLQNREGLQEQIREVDRALCPQVVLVMHIDSRYFDCLLGTDLFFFRTGLLAHTLSGLSVLGRGDQFVLSARDRGQNAS